MGETRMDPLDDWPSPIFPFEDPVPFTKYRIRPTTIVPTYVYILK